jgi:hypothetical protein
MTADRDRDRPTNPEVALLAWRRDMTQFRQMNINVQGADEAGCLAALDAELDKFAVKPDDWTLVSARYTRETVATTQGGETVLTVWMLDAVMIKTDGLVPWSGLDG